MTATPLFDGPMVPADVLLPEGLRIVPRDYQCEALAEGLRLILGGSRGVLCRLPTGTGKTVLGTMFIAWWLARGPEYRVLVVSHERQLVGQFADEIEGLTGIRPGIEMAEQRVYGDDMPRVIVSCRATLLPRKGKDNVDASRLLKFDPLKYKWLVILDEVHRWAFKLKSCRHVLAHFEQNPESVRFGLTATPLRGDGVSLAKVCPDVAIDYRLYDVDGGPCAVRDGWAVPYDQRFIQVEGVDFKNLSEVRHDFDEHELDAILTTRTEMLSLVRPLLDLAGTRRTIVFCPGVGSAKLVALTINAELGKTAAVSLHGEVPEDMRKKVYRQHQSGAFQFLVVCGLCREGYNDPGIQAVAVFRPTKSRTLAEQMKGRGCRPLRGLVDGLPDAAARLEAIAASAKPSCMVIDLVGVTGLADCASTAHILAAGKPDEVIERANRNALAAQGPVDMEQALLQAQAELWREATKAELARLRRRDAQERDRERRQREAQEARERSQADKQAKIQADVRYRENRVDQGRGGRSRNRDGRARMPFGKYKGQLVSKLPTWYLRHAQQWKLQDWLAQAVEAELLRRDQSDQQTGAA